MPTSPTPVTPLSTPPSTTSPSNFDARADAFLGELPTFQTEFNSVANITYNNAVEANTSATTATTQATNSANSATASSASATASANSATSALAYAQAAGASAGIPTPTPNAYLQTTSGSVPVWGGAPVDANKLDKQGGTANKISYTYSDLGSITASGTATLNANDATVFRVQALGAITINLTNLPSGSVSGDIEGLFVNFGGKSLTFTQTINWIKPDGSYAASPALAGITFQTSGTDRVLFMIDNGTISAKVMR